MKVELEQIDHTYLRVHTSEDIERELEYKFTFKVPGAHFMPLYKAKRWDGKSRLYNRRFKTVPCGLAHRIQDICRERGYEFKYQFPQETYVPHEFAIQDKFQVRPYQLETVQECIRSTRLTVESPTGSGKSLIIYLLMDYYWQRTNGKFLVVVPTLDLVSQMSDDFLDYTTRDLSDQIFQIHGDQKDKLSHQRIVVSTWQSIYKKPASWFDQFSVFFGDEAHEWKADAPKKIAMNTSQVRYKFGMTGSADNRDLYKLTVEGLFGRSYVSADVQELQNDGYLAQMNPVKMIQLYHSWVDYPMTYDQEVDYLIESDTRNQFITKLAMSLTGITLILFLRHKHGETLYEMIEGHDKYLTYGKVKREARKDQRSEIKQKDNAIIVASTGVFSRGIDITHIANIILASPSKARGRLIQSIGRGLRPDDRKEALTIYDISDRFATRKQNTTFRHMKERIKVYDERGHEYLTYKINLLE